MLAFQGGAPLITSSFRNLKISLSPTRQSYVPEIQQRNKWISMKVEENGNFLSFSHAIHPFFVLQCFPELYTLEEIPDNERS